MNLETLGKRLAIEEGDRLAAYLDTKGILTVGRGHNCIARPVEGVNQPGDRITDEQDDALFQADVADACIQLDNNLPWWSALDDGRQNVMLDMAFNMGIQTLMTFNNTLAHIEAGEYDEAAAGMAQSRWAKQVGNRAVFLENAMRTGVY
jgi:lysozyme